MIPREALQAAIRDAAAEAGVSADEKPRLMRVGDHIDQFVYDADEWVGCPANEAGQWPEDGDCSDSIFDFAVAFDKLMEARFKTSGPYLHGGVYVRVTEAD